MGGLKIEGPLYFCIIAIEMRPLNVHFQYLVSKILRPHNKNQYFDTDGLNSEIPLYMYMHLHIFPDTCGAFSF